MVTNILEGCSAVIFRMMNSPSVTGTVHRNISAYLPVDMVLYPKMVESSMLLCGSLQKVCVWWQHSALLHMTTHNMCGTSGIIAAVTEVPCFYDVRCCLAVDRERLQGSY